MIHYFVLFLILTAASSIGAFSLLQMNQSTQALVKAQSERQNLDMLEYALISKLQAFGSNQGLAAPLGVNDATDANSDGSPDLPYQMLPDGLGIKKTNAWGRPFVYCPHYPEAVDFSVSTESVWTGKTEGDSSNYLTGVVTDHAGSDYVVQADQVLDASMSGRKVIAMIISPLPSSADAPSCQEVTYTPATNEYKVPNGIVRVIEQSNSVAYLSGGRSVTVVDSDDYATQNLNTMLDKVGANNPDLIMLDLSANASNYTFASDFTFSDASPGNNRSVVIEGEGAGSTVIDAASPVTLSFDGVDVLIKNVTLTDNVRLNVTNGELITNDVALSRTTISDSEWTLKNAVSVIDGSTDASVLEVFRSTVAQNNSDLTIQGGASKTTIMSLHETNWSLNTGQLTLQTAVANTIGLNLLDDSSMFTNNATVRIQRDASAAVDTETAIFVDQRSALSFSGSTLVNTYPAVTLVLNHGALAFESSDMTSTALILNGIRSSLGAVITIDDNSRIGLNIPPTTAVVDEGLSMALGKNSSVYSTNVCWQGPVFNGAKNGTGDSSEVTKTPEMIFNQSIWACNP